jgi:hypothetical protein
LIQLSYSRVEGLTTSHHQGGKPHLQVTDRSPRKQTVRAARGVKARAARGIKISAVLRAESKSALRAESKVTDRPGATSLRFSALVTTTTQ